MAPRFTSTGATFARSGGNSRAALVFSVLVLLSCLASQQRSVSAQWAGTWGSSLAGRGQMSTRGGGRGFGSWRGGMMGGEDAEEWQEEMEERGGSFRFTGPRTGRAGAGGTPGGSSAEEGNSMEELPSWMQFLRYFLRARIETWRKNQKQQQPPTPPPQPQMPPAQPQMPPTQPQIPPTQPQMPPPAQPQMPPAQPQLPLVPNAPSLLPDASSGLVDTPLGALPIDSPTGPSPVPSPLDSFLGLTPMSGPSVPAPEPRLALPTLPPASATSGSPPAGGAGATEVIDLNMSVDDDVRPTGGFALKMWLCDQEGGVCAYQCENQSDTIGTVDCGTGPQGKLFCCDQ